MMWAKSILSFAMAIVLAFSMGIVIDLAGGSAFGQSLETQSPDTQSVDSQLTNQATESADLQEPKSTYKISARFHLQEGTNKGYLVLQFDLAKGSYIYALTQAGDLPPSKIQVIPSDEFEVTGNFNPDKQPIVEENDPVFNQRVEKHKGKIQFFVPIEVAETVDLAEFQPELVFNGQVCSDMGICMPLRNKSIKANFAGFFERSVERRESSQNTNRR